MPDETKSGNQDSLPKGQTSDAANESTSKQPKDFVSLKEHEEKLSNIRAEDGRKIKAYETENATLKSQMEANLRTLNSYESKLADLTKQIADLSKDDPDKFKYVTKYTELQESENKLKDAQEALRKEREANQERIERAEKFELELNTTKIAEEFENSDSQKLYRLVSKLSDKSEENIREVASTLWDKKQGQEEPPAKPDSGRTTGGGLNFTQQSIKNMTPQEYAKNRDEIIKAINEGRLQEK